MATGVAVTRFLFPEDAQQAKTVYESDGALVPAITSDGRPESRASILPPVGKQPSPYLKAKAPDIQDIDLAHYKHYDVQIDWAEDEIDTSVWAPDVQQYTRMFYARYGNGPPGSTPWRLGKGLRARFSDMAVACSEQDLDSLMSSTEAEMRALMAHTPLELWQQFCSDPIHSVDLEFVKAWATTMRPRSIHDLKPMLMLCQGLLKDLPRLYELQLEQARKELQAAFEDRLDAAEAAFKAREEALHSRIAELDRIVSTPPDPSTFRIPAERQREIDAAYSSMQQQYEVQLAQMKQNAADLQSKLVQQGKQADALAQQVRQLGGTPKTADGKIILGYDAQGNAILAQTIDPTRGKVMGFRADGSPVYDSDGAAALAEIAILPNGTPLAPGLVVDASGAVLSLADLPTNSKRTASGRYRTPSGRIATPASTSSVPAGSTRTPSGRYRTPSGRTVTPMSGRAIVGHNADGTPIYAQVDSSGRVILGSNADGSPIYAEVDESGRVIIGRNSDGSPIFADDDALKELQAEAVALVADVVVPAGRDANGREIYKAADGTELVIAGWNDDGTPIYAVAGDTGKLVIGFNPDGSPITVDRPVVGLDADGRPIYADAAAVKAAVASNGMLDIEKLVQAGVKPIAQVVGTAPDGTPIVLSEDLVVGRAADGSPIYAAGTVVGYTEDGKPILSDGKGGTITAASDAIIGHNADGSPIFAAGTIIGYREDGSPIVSDGGARKIAIPADAILGRTESGRPIYKEGTVIGLDENGRPIVADGTGGSRAATPQEMARLSPRVSLPIDVPESAVIGRTGSGRPIYAEGTVIGYDEFGNAVVADGKGGTRAASSIKAQGAAFVEAMLQKATDAAASTVATMRNAFDKGRVGQDAQGDTAVANYLLRALSMHQESGKVHASVSGKVVSKSGGGDVFVMGNVAVDASGAFVGRVNAKGEVVRADGQTLGAVSKAATRKEGAAQRGDSLSLTAAAIQKVTEGIKEQTQITALTAADGSAIGFAGPDGFVVDPTGAHAGLMKGNKIVDPHGYTLAVADKIVTQSAAGASDAVLHGLATQGLEEAGAVQHPAKLGYAVSPCGAVLGQVMADGRVINSAGVCVGYMQPDGSVLSPSGLKIAVAKEGVSVRDAKGNLIGVITGDGELQDMNGHAMEGQVTSDGRVLGKHGSLRGVGVVATVTPYAALRNDDGDIIGYEHMDGTLRDLDGNIIGRATPDGVITDLNGNALDDVELDSTVSLVMDVYGNACAARKESMEVTPLNASEVSVLEGGLLANKEGEVIGSAIKVVAAGMSVVTLHGMVIGDVHVDGIAYSTQGDVLGAVDEASVIRNRAGDVVGFVSSNKGVRDATGTLIGTVVEQSSTVTNLQLEATPSLKLAGYTVYSGEDAVGYVQSHPPPLMSVNTDDNDLAVGLVQWCDQRAILDDGSELGRLSTSGALVDADGEEISGHYVGLPEDAPYTSLPVASDYDGDFMGYILPSNAIVDESGATIGAMMPDGVALSPSHKPIGVCNTAGFSTSRTVVGINRRPLGYLQPDGHVISTISGDVTGMITPSGKVIDIKGNYVGLLKPSTLDGYTFAADGTVRDAAGNIVGKVGNDGQVILNDGTLLRSDGRSPTGSISSDSSKDLKTSQSRHMTREEKVVEVEDKAVQAVLDGMTLAELRQKEQRDREATEEAAARGASGEASADHQTRAGSHMRMLRAAAKMAGLNARARRRLLEEQLAKLAELRADLIAKLQSKKVKDSLTELRKYRRPPRAAAQVITSLMVVCNEPSCLEWRMQALNGLKFPDHANHVAQIWVSLSPLLQPNLAEKLQNLDITEVSTDMDERLLAGKHLMQGTTDKDAKRASIVVRLLFEFVELAMATNARAKELATLGQQ